MNHIRVAEVFNNLFAGTQRTVLRGGAAEPFYQPSTQTTPAILHYREDFAASALHEIAHWCIAGTARRGLVDFGYDYQPPPRTAEQQSCFFALELKAQTVELVLSQNAGIRFQPSADNLAAGVQSFMTEIRSNLRTIERWMATSADARAINFCQALKQDRAQNPSCSAEYPG